MKNKRKFSFFFITLALFMTLANISAYNTKFSFSIVSGWLSPWAHSDYSYKVTAKENPVVKTTYVSNKKTIFQYSVMNSNNEHRVDSFKKKGTFGTTAFSRNIMNQNTKYKLAVRRQNGAWNSSSRADGQWNPDSY